MKKLIPPSIRLYIKLTLRHCSDWLKGHNKKFARHHLPNNNFYEIVCIGQVLKATESSANKIHNLSAAIDKLNNIIIPPGQVFSFWKLIGTPSEKNGYKKSRSIIKGELEAAVGGGLCQLSGLIYFLAIKAGLTITERHTHSLDIYTEEERFTPLGSDATVVYGYKDLRFVNPFTFSVCLQFGIGENMLTGKLLAAERFDANEIEFLYEKSPGFTNVITIQKTKAGSAVIAKSRYIHLHQ